MYKDCEIGSIPTNWNIQKLEELANVTGGKRLPKGSSLSEINNGHPYIRVSDMNDKGIQLDSMLYVPDDVVEQISRYRVDKDDLYISVAGTLGLVGKVPDELNGANLTENADRISNIRCNTDFLLYCLKSDFIKKIINSEMTTNAQPKLALTRIKQFPIPVPPLKEQQKIAEILSSVDAAIEKTEQVIAKTEEVKKGLMQQILTKGIGHTEFKQTEIGEIPVGWNVINLEEICSLITYGFTNPMPTTDEGPYMITAKDIRDGDIQYKTARKTSMECYSNDLTDKSRPSIGDILITKDGTLGRLAIVKQEDICINQSVARIVLKDINLVKYIYYLLDSPQVQTRILAESGGSTIKHIYITKLAKTLIPISTDVEETKNITNILDSYDYKISSEKRKCNYLINIKKGLMQQLLTGQVRVKID